MGSCRDCFGYLFNFVSDDATVAAADLKEPQGSYHAGAWSRARRRRGRRPLQILENLLGSRSHV